MRSRASVLFLLTVLLVGGVVPPALGTHTLTPPDRFRILYEKGCPNTPGGTPEGSAPGSPDTAIQIVHRDAATGIETTYYLHPDPIVNATTGAKNCPLIDQAAVRHWNASDSAPTLKPGDQYRFLVRYHQGGANQGCRFNSAQPISNTAPSYAGRMTGVNLGLNGTMDVRGAQGVDVTFANKSHPEGWFVVPKPGDRVTIDAGSVLGTNNNTATPFDRASATDTTLAGNKFAVTYRAMYVCPSSPAGAVTTWVAVKNQTHFLWLELDNVLPEVYVRSSHAPALAAGAANPSPAQDLAWSASNPDLFTTGNATVKQSIWFNVTICDADFEPSKYLVVIDFQVINRSTVQDPAKKVSWQSRFTRFDVAPACGARAGWILNQTVVVADKAFDKVLDTATGKFRYPGILVDVSDDATGFPGGRGNTAAVGVALNIDAQRPLAASSFGATALPGGAVRLDWAIPFAGSAHLTGQHDLRQIEITIAALDTPATSRTIILRNGTTLVNASNAGVKPCVTSANTTAARASTRNEQWTSAAKLPQCLIIPDPILLAGGLPLAAGGASRAYSFTLVTRDDAGNTPVAGLQAVATLDAIAPTITPHTLPPTGGVSRLSNLVVHVADDTASTFGGPAIATATVSLRDTASGQWWNGAAWVAGAEVFLPMTATTGDRWSLDPRLVGNGKVIAVKFRFVDAAGNAATLERTVTHDALPPSLSVAAPDAHPQGHPLTVTATGADNGDRIRVLNLTVIAADGAVRANWTWCVGVACGWRHVTDVPATGPWALRVDGAGADLANLTRLYENLTLGVYSIRVQAFDGAWNSVQAVRNGVTIVPRASLPVTPQTPYYAGTKLTARVIAGYDGVTGPNGLACPIAAGRGLCAPEVAIEGLTTAGTWREVARETRPDGPDETTRNYTYRFDAVEVGNLGAAPKIRVKVEAAGVATTLAPVDAKTPATEGVSFSAPIAGWAPDRWFITRNPASATAEFRLTAAAEALGNVRVRVTNLTTGAAAWSTPASAPTYTVPLAGTPDGEYELLVCPVDAANSTTTDVARCVHPVRRSFAVETGPASLTAEINNRAPAFNWAARSFVVNGAASIGRDNLSSVQKIGFRADATSGTFKIGTYRIDLLTTDPSASSYALRVTVEMDATSTLGATANLVLTARTDSGLDLSWTKAVTHDGVPAIVPTPRLVDGVPVELFGWANDTASGVEDVRVTFTRDDGRWWNGTGWAAAPAEGILLVPTCATPARLQCEWRFPLKVSTSNGDVFAVPLADTGRSYTTKVVARDIAGNAGGPAPLSARFDNLAPTIAAPSAATGSLVAGGTAVLDVRVTDAHSGVRAVEAVVRRPGGGTTTYPLALTNAADGTWRLSLAGDGVPYAGTYGVRLTARDGGDLVAERPEVTFVVADDAPVAFAAMTVLPSPAENWTGAVVEATVVERAAVTAIEVNVSLAGQPGTWKPMEPVSVDPVSGAGLYRLRTIGNFTLARGATFTVTVRADDAAHDAATRSALLPVSANDRPRIRFERPPVAGTTWVTAEPTLTWTIEDDNAAPTSVWVEVVAGGATLNLTRTVTAVPEGLRVVASVAPALQAGGGALLRLVVIDQLGARNVSEVMAAVDAAGPAIVVETAGTVDRASARYATPGTILRARAADAGSGIAALERSLDGGVTWTSAAEDVTLEGWDTLANGTLTVLFRALDHAGNAASAEIVLEVDKDRPVLSLASVAREVKLGIVEPGVGVVPTGVVVHVKSPLQSAFFPVVAAFNATSGLFEARVPANVSGRYTWYAEARDKAANVGTLGSAATPLVGFTHNLAPSLLVVGIPNGTTVRGSVPLLWLADDPEAQPVNITAKVRKGTVTSIIGGGLNSTSIRWDTTQVADGDAVLVFEATDGKATTIVERKVRIYNAKVILLARAPASALPGDPLTVRFEPTGNLTVRNATATVQREEAGKWTPVATGLALVAGKDGVFKLDWTAPAPGKYRMLLEIEYDGVAGMENLTWGPVEVAQARPPEPAPLLSPFMLAVVAGIILLVAGAAVAAWRWRT